MLKINMSASKNEHSRRSNANSNNLICPISHNTITQASIINCCGAVFEKNMIQTAFNIKKECPLCRQKEPIIEDLPIELASDPERLAEKKTSLIEKSKIAKLFNTSKLCT